MRWRLRNFYITNLLQHLDAFLALLWCLDEPELCGIEGRSDKLAVLAIMLIAIMLWLQIVSAKPEINNSIARKRSVKICI